MSTTTTPTTTTYRVTCQDGASRHEPFTTRDAADHWAEWGHACTTGHVVTEERPAPTAAAIVPTDGARVEIRYADTIPARPDRGVLLADVWRTEDTDHPSGLGAAHDGAAFVIGARPGAVRSVIVDGADAPSWRIAHGERVTVCQRPATADEESVGHVYVWTVESRFGVGTFYGPAVRIVPIPRAVPIDDDGQDDGPRCVVCGDPADYCQGHGPTGDPYGWDILAAHDDGDHTRCHPAGCDA